MMFRSQYICYKYTVEISLSNEGPKFPYNYLGNSINKKMNYLNNTKWVFYVQKPSSGTLNPTFYIYQWRIHKNKNKKLIFCIRRTLRQSTSLQ